MDDLQRTRKELENQELLLETTSLISKTDAKGRIIYANDKFCEVSGYTERELEGKDHRLVNSRAHPKQLWIDMYQKTIKDREIWYHLVTNRNKYGRLYYVKSWIQAQFGIDDKLEGFISIRQDVTELINQQIEIANKNTYLEHAAKILRHDMHSGINTYLPRGISSLKRRITEEVTKELKLEAPLKMLEEGLLHTQKVYKGVYEFTNLVKPNAILETKRHNLSQILDDYLSRTSYYRSVVIEDTLETEVNESLFCTAVDNLIRNGLKYNDSPTKYVKFSYDSNTNCILIEDNGRGLSQEEFEILSKPYIRKADQKETGTGLGLNICVAILQEHKFILSCTKKAGAESGTIFRIDLGTLRDFFI